MQIQPSDGFGLVMWVVCVAKCQWNNSVICTQSLVHVRMCKMSRVTQCTEHVLLCSLTVLNCLYFTAVISDVHELLVQIENLSSKFWLKVSLWPFNEQSIVMYSECLSWFRKYCSSFSVKGCGLLGLLPFSSRDLFCSQLNSPIRPTVYVHCLHNHS